MRADPSIDLGRLRLERLQRLRATLVDFDCAGAVFLDPINIRYATDVSNMQVWGLHNPARYAFIASEGPVILFEFPSCAHLGERMELIDEVRFLTARQLIIQSEKLADIATHLGYADAGSFTRAFERWTGMSPMKYRKQFCGGSTAVQHKAKR